MACAGLKMMFPVLLFSTLTASVLLPNIIPHWTNNKVLLYNTDSKSMMTANATSSKAFTSTLCNSTDGTVQFCYSSLKCAKIGGESGKPCAQGKGVCCVVGKSCHNFTMQVESYFVNPSYPNEDTVGTTCEYHIDITNKNICQLRLDLENMSLLGPERRTGLCRRDRFVAMATNPKDFGRPVLCGDNSGQHMYVPINVTNERTYVTLAVVASGAKPYHWRVRSTQIDCIQHPELTPPVGCLQFHDGLSGSIKSFNYAEGKGYYQSRLEYAVCIMRWPDICSIQYRQADNSVFWINSAEGANLTEGIGRTGSRSCNLHTQDYLFIADGRAPKEVVDEIDGFADPQGGASTETSSLFCGRGLSGLAVVENVKRLKAGNVYDMSDNMTAISNITSFAAGPFAIRFHSDYLVVPKQEIGFHIVFQQLYTGCTWPY